MKCSNPDCNRSIGLIAYRRGWFGQRRYCSKRCRDSFVIDRARQSQRKPATYFEWFLCQPIESPLIPVHSRTKAR
jgi:hypothetical protein